MRDDRMLDAGRALPEKQRDKLRPNLEKSLDKTEKRKNLSPSEIAFVLQVGKVAKSALGADAGAVLLRTPGPADADQLAIFNLITSEYRNGKTHPVAGSARNFTTCDDMRALRMLIFGFDEEKTVSQKKITDGISRTSWLSKQETGQAIDRVSQGWGKFLGVVPVLWRALDETSARKTTAA